MTRATVQVAQIVHVTRATVQVARARHMNNLGDLNSRARHMNNLGDLNSLASSHCEVRTVEPPARPYRFLFIRCSLFCACKVLTSELPRRFSRFSGRLLADAPDS